MRVFSSYYKVCNAALKITSAKHSSMCTVAEALMATRLCLTCTTVLLNLRQADELFTGP